MNWQQLIQQPVSDILHWVEKQPWCRAMSACLQDSEWHAEGDVWTHTKMVCEELRRLEGWTALTPRQQSILTFTAILHDVAKPLTTELDPETGRVRTPKHAVKGEILARTILRELECDLTTREEICRLVRYHGRPAFLLEREDPIQELVRLSWLLNHRLLYLFALADTRGRDTDCMSRPEENLHYWKIMAEEAGCFDCSWPFPSDHARFHYFQQDQGELLYSPHEKYSCTVTMMSGVPGSGKDTWLSRHRSELPVVSLDEIRGELEIDPTDNQGQVAQEAQERCREYLRSGTSFVFNATNTLRATRSRWIRLFAAYDARIEIVYLEPPLKTILKQNKLRSKSVPTDVIESLIRRVEPPTMLECHSLSYIE